MFNLIKLFHAATSGLSEVYNSLAYRVAEIEHHFHRANLCYGKAAGDELLQDSLVPFVCTAGAIGVLGALTTVSAGGVVSGAFMDPNRVMVTAASGSAGDIYEIVLYYGVASPDTFLTSFYYTVPAAGNQKADGVDVGAFRIPVSSKLGAKCKCSNADETVSFLIELHNYAA